MRYLKILGLLGICFLAAVPYAHAQRWSVGIGIGGPDYGYGPAYVGPPPDCVYGYYDYYPYECAPYGFYGPSYFSGGFFIGAGPWYGSYYGRPGFRGGFVDRGRGFGGGGFRDRDDRGRGYGGEGFRGGFQGGGNFQRGGGSRSGGGFQGGGGSQRGSGSRSGGGFQGGGGSRNGGGFQGGGGSQRGGGSRNGGGFQGGGNSRGGGNSHGGGRR